MKDDQFGQLTWSDDIWEGMVTFARFREWGAALDEKDPPDTRPAEAPDPSPTKRQLEARDQLEQFASGMGGENGAALASMLSGFLDRMAAPPAPQDTSTEDEPDEEEDELIGQLRGGTCTLYIETKNDARKKPTKAQRAAWQMIVDRGEAIWDELLVQSFEYYQRQLPVRRKWWKAVYGNYLLEQRLPEVKTIEQFRRLVRPFAFRINAPPEGAKTVDIRMHVMATWEVDGLGVVIRDARLVEFGQVIDTVHVPQRVREMVDHPVFGVLRRIPSDDVMEFINEWEMPEEPGKSGLEKARRVATRPWLGYARFDPLTQYSNVADHRAEYAHDRARADRPESRMRWEFANGEFELRVYAHAGQPPSDEQVQAWQAFKEDERRYAAEMSDAIFQQYQETCDVRRRNWKDRYVDDMVPILKDKNGLKELIQLIEIQVHPADVQGQVTIAFAFVAAYDYDGFTAFWRGGTFDEWGLRKDAEFKGFR
jgi:hypothetical protein